MGDINSREGKGMRLGAIIDGVLIAWCLICWVICVVVILVVGVVSEVKRKVSNGKGKE